MKKFTLCSLTVVAGLVLAIGFASIVDAQATGTATPSTGPQYMSPSMDFSAVGTSTPMVNPNVSTSSPSTSIPSATSTFPMQNQMFMPLGTTTATSSLQNIVGTSSLQTFQARTAVMNGMWPHLMNRTELSMGSMGPAVVALQNYLMAADMLPMNSFTPGVFDAATRTALMNYQRAVHLPSTGYFGPYTQAHMAIVLMVRPQGIMMY